MRVSSISRCRATAFAGCPSSAHNQVGIHASGAAGQLVRLRLHESDVTKQEHEPVPSRWASSKIGIQRRDDARFRATSVRVAMGGKGGP